MSGVTNFDGRLEVMAGYCKLMYENIAKNNNVYHDETENVYAKSLPEKYLDFIGIKKIGGKTLVINQLVENGNFGSTNKWDTFNCSFSVSSNVALVTVTVTGTVVLSNVFSYKNTHTFYIAASINNNTSNSLNLALYGSDTLIDGSSSGISSGTSGVIKRILKGNSEGNTKRIQIYGSNLVADETFTVSNVVCIDLTLMFGAGNEPTTVAEFEAMFPASYYAYNAGTLFPAGVSNVISKDSSNNVVANMPIPSAIQSLTGYGWSAGSAYNYIDFENKKFVQTVGAVDLSDLDLGYGPTVGWNATLPNVKNPADDGTVFNGTSDNYAAVSRNTQATAFSGGTDAGMISVSGGKVYVGTGDIDIVPSGTLYYELATPVETDISEYLTDTDIEVELGGSLTFPNQHGDDYKIPVPVQAEYVGL